MDKLILMNSNQILCTTCTALNIIVINVIAAFSSSEDNPKDENKPKSFFMRMKCTLVRRGGAYTKSSGFKVWIV